LDESTDFTNVALLLVFERYCADSKVYVNLLFCQKVPTRTTAAEIIRCLDTHFANKSIDWANSVGVCTDGGRAASNDWDPSWCC